MASMDDVPYLTRYVVPLCSHHGYNAVFDPQKCNIAPIWRVDLSLCYMFLISYLGPTLFARLL